LERKGVLWVGRIDEPKRLEWLLEIAKGCPDLHFDIVGRPHGRDEYIQKLEMQISLLHNVVHHGYIPPEKMPEYYARACVLCCTSRFEGFPNTFLEAWSHGVPIVSTVDPDGMISERRLGIVSTQISGLIAGIRTLIDSPDVWKEISANSLAYYQENHTPEAVMPQFEKLFGMAVEGAKHVILEK
jgi:glycosyltransferase involved in cell wall biosynthesis